MADHQRLASSLQRPFSEPFAGRVEMYRDRMEQYLESCLPDEKAEPRDLHSAMRYSVLGGGKRVRPLLTYATGEVLGVAADKLDAIAASVELIHAFSLVHDDLPAMDNDDLRRGKPTTHKAFGEASAILAGDALQMLAFSVLTKNATQQDCPAATVKAIDTLALASGSLGMTGGQAFDLASEGKAISLAELETLHQHKTGCLIRAAVVMASYASSEIDDEAIHHLDEFARCIGLAFQIRDDVLDVEGDTEVIGKPQGSDEGQNKATYPSLLGLATAKKRAEGLYQNAMEHLDTLNRETEPLRWMAEYIVKRDR